MALAAGAVVIALLSAERARPLRIRTRPSLPRTIRNAALGASCAATIAAVEKPLIHRIARSNEMHGRGLAQKLPRPLRLIGGIAAMDYGFYLWHVATHKVPSCGASIACITSTPTSTLRPRCAFIRWKCSFRCRSDSFRFA